MRRLILAAFASCLITLPSFAKKATFGEILRHALEQSDLTVPGSQPFHLVAMITEKDEPDSDHVAEIEEFWVASDKWKRTIKSPDFTQIVIRNGDKTYEINDDDYYPRWLHTLVTALFDPVPTAEDLKKNQSEMEVPRGDRQESCLRLEAHVGTPPVQNTVFSNICFDGKHALLTFVGSPGYSAEFRDYKTFGTKEVARSIIDHPEPGTELDLRVTELSPLQPDNSLFQPPAEPSKFGSVTSVNLGEATMRQLLKDPYVIPWPPIRAGKTSGVLSVYVAVDREGKVREVYPLNSDNPSLDDAARGAVKKWTFKPAASHGSRVQTEAVLTFPFESKIEYPVPILSDREARKLATAQPEPRFPEGIPHGKLLKVRINVDEQGSIMGLTNIEHLSFTEVGAINVALHQWRFRPYVHEGKTDRFDADLEFLVP